MAQGNRWTAIRAHNFVLVNSLGVLSSQSQYETQLRQVVKAEERESPLSHLLSSNPPDDGVETVLVTLLSLPPFSKSPLFPFLMFLLNLEKTWREKAASTKHTTAALKCKSQWQIINHNNQNQTVQKFVENRLDNEKDSGSSICVKLG